MKLKAQLSIHLILRLKGKGAFREEIFKDRIKAKLRKIKRRRKIDGYYINGKA